jgi:hypothetical protein
MRGSLTRTPATGEAHRPAGGGAPGASGLRTEQHHEPYEPPVVRDLGTIAEMTRGTVPSTSDALGPGSALP